ncbi:MAG: hypothetical protein ACJAX5_002397 [Patiriisocius sp.]|jgi:hypothetical protein
MTTPKSHVTFSKPTLSHRQSFEIIELNIGVNKHILVEKEHASLRTCVKTQCLDIALQLDRLTLNKKHVKSKAPGIKSEIWKRLKQTI